MGLTISGIFEVFLKKKKNFSKMSLLNQSDVVERVIICW
jgi:hypothetical protein